MSARRAFWLVLLGFLLLHVVLAAALPLSGDEAYYWDCSRHLSWSYFDQPPLVIWAMVPFRAVLGETRLAVRLPAILASLLTGLLLLGLLRRFGGGHREATHAYVLLHAMPLFFLGAFYASTDVAMTTAYVGAAWAAVALAQGERRAWWGFGLAVGLGFLAKFPVVLVLPALLPALLRRDVRRQLATATPWLAALLAFALTLPVWIWGARHEWANLAFQLAGRHEAHRLTLKYLGEFVAANLALATPFLAVAMIVAWWRGWRRRDPAWTALLLAMASPLLVFGLVALRERVGAHWGGPALVLGAAAVVLTPFRARRVLEWAAGVTCLVLVTTVIVIALMPEPLMALQWSYAGRPGRISTSKLTALVGNREITRTVEARLEPGELVASESYSTVHLLAFLSGGDLPARLADVNHGKHGLASLYWYPPKELRGRDVLFVTERSGRVDEALAGLFASVEERPSIDIVRDGHVVRRVRVLQCRDLLRPVPAFTRLGGGAATAGGR